MELICYTRLQSAEILSNIGKDIQAQVLKLKEENEGVKIPGKKIILSVGQRMNIAQRLNRSKSTAKVDDR